MENNKNNSFICPVCGSELSVCNNNHGENTAANNGQRVSKAEQRIAELKKHGITTDGFFAVNAMNGQDYIFRMIDGKPSFVEDDEITRMIREEGTIPERRLFRQHIMAQVFRMLDKNGPWKGDYHKAMQSLGYDYVWEMMLDEFKSQSRMERNGDVESLKERQMFFSKIVVVSSMTDYIFKFRQYIEHRDVHTNRNGVKWQNLFGRRITDVEKDKFLNELEGIHKTLSQNYGATANDIYASLKKWMSVAMPTKHGKAYEFFYNQPYLWQQAFKGAGAYFTLKNLILFNHVELSGITCTKENQLKVLKDYAMGHQGYEVLGLLKVTLNSNQFNITKMREQWRVDKLNKLGK